MRERHNRPHNRPGVCDCADTKPGWMPYNIQEHPWHPTNGMVHRDAHHTGTGTIICNMCQRRRPNLYRIDPIILEHMRELERQLLDGTLSPENYTSEAQKLPHPIQLIPTCD